MKIHTLRLANFRGFEHIELDLHDRLTLLVGLNASGKPALLDGLAIALGAWLGGTAQAGAEDRPIHKTDARLVRQEQDGLPTLNPSYPVRVRADGTVQGRQVSWTRELRRATGRTTSGGARALRQIAADTERKAAQDPNVSLPLLAYYGTGRLWVQKRNWAPRQPLGSRMQGYAACLESAQNTRLFQRWMAWREGDHLQRLATARENGADPGAIPTPHLDAVAEAAKACLDGAARLFYSVNHQDLRLELSDGSVLPFAALSDGQRSLVVLAADIAWRAAQLNPQLGRSAPGQTKGVVLIDEIELHLHPAWQRRVIDDLTRSPRVDAPGLPERHRGGRARPGQGHQRHPPRDHGGPRASRVDGRAARPVGERNRSGAP
ncbi:MAG: AAA family ATPase [Oligoflexia bacterium]|nr:AAA family ATPase [Oligoflexia bacterium]